MVSEIKTFEMAHHDGETDTDVLLEYTVDPGTDRVDILSVSHVLSRTPILDLDLVRRMKSDPDVEVMALEGYYDGGSSAG